MARVEVTSDAAEDIRELDGSERKAVLKALVKLGTEPDKRGQPLGSRAGGTLPPSASPWSATVIQE